MANAPEPPSLVELVRVGVLDAELAALVWVLADAGVPIVVGAPADRAGAATQLLEGILGSLGVEADLSRPLDAADARALLSGRRRGAVVVATSLEEVRGLLSGPGLLLTEEELSFLGCVLILGGEGSGPLRVVASHYVRPLARDVHGHTQMLGPAVLSTWDAGTGRWEHFEWGVLSEIAARLGQRHGDFEADLHHRRDDLAGLATARVTSLAEVRRLIAGYRAGYGHAHGAAPEAGAPH